jgi:uncharacterized protein DUF2695
MNESDEFIAAITPDVMKVLESSRFFGRLDDLLSPEDRLLQPEKCDGSFRLSERLLRESGLDEDDSHDVFAVLRAKGSFCDCEVLYNASESNRLKAAYWRKRAAEDPPGDLSR